MLSLGRLLIAAGLMLALAGVVLVLAERLPFRPGRLPGDIVWRGRNTTFYFPLATSLLLSVVLSLVLWAISKWR